MSQKNSASQFSKSAKCMIAATVLLWAAGGLIVAQKLSTGPSGSKSRPSFTTSVGALASGEIATQTVPPVEEEVIEPAAYAEPRGVGSCAVGDRITFVGGWMVGSAGLFPFSDPVGLFEDILHADPAEQERILQDHPLKLGASGACEGAGHVRPLSALLAEPLGGGTLAGGKFIVALIRMEDLGGPTNSCFVTFRSEDVICAREE